MIYNVKLQDFARQQGVTDRQIQRLLKKYEDEFNGLVERKGHNGTWLTEDACDILRGKMKYQPVNVYDVDETTKDLQRKLDAKTERVAELLEELNDAKSKIIELQELKNTIELHEAHVAALSDDNKSLEEKLKKAEERTDKVFQAFTDFQKDCANKEGRMQNVIDCQSRHIAELESRTLFEFIKAKFAKKGKENDGNDV